jgi:hypothetical protein
LLKIVRTSKLNKNKAEWFFGLEIKAELTKKIDRLYG